MPGALNRSAAPARPANHPTQTPTPPQSPTQNHPVTKPQPRPTTPPTQPNLEQPNHHPQTQAHPPKAPTLPPTPPTGGRLNDLFPSRWQHMLFFRLTCPQGRRWYESGIGVPLRGFRQPHPQRIKIDEHDNKAETSPTCVQVSCAMAFEAGHCASTRCPNMLWAGNACGQ